MQVPAGSISILLNPAPAPSGQLNPFSLKDIRFALQYVVNRDLVASQIYKGLAAPMITQVSPFDYDYLATYDVAKDANIRYDPEFAARVVQASMTSAGAVMQNGVWTYHGSPIHLKFIVRVEDERKDVGDLVSSELRKLGFTVDEVFQEFGPAIAAVYGTDPSLFEWSLYTEGWGRGGPERYDSANVNQMCAPWFGNMPGWKQLGFWQYQNSTIDRIGQSIFTGNFTDVAARNSLYRQATKMCLQDSVRLWVVTQLSSFPITSAVQGLSLDSVSGPHSLVTLREAYLPGSKNLSVGAVWVWTARTIWNPVGGFTDVYSNNIWRNLFDPPTWRNPFTGVPAPFRASYSVQTAGPTESLPVPPDSVLWDAQSGRWKAVGSGITATSKVTFNYKDYFASKWHDGQPITMADIFYGLYQLFDITYNPDKSKIEFSIATVEKPYLDTFRGFKIINDTSVEVYMNYWHFIPSYIAEYASLSGLTTPWEVLAAMDNLVFQQRHYAYSETAAEKYSVPWLSLVEDSNALDTKTALGSFLDKQFFPSNVFSVGGRTIASPGDAAARYQSAIAWYRQHGHMVISNGPFYLKTFDPTSQFAEIDAFRDPSYPFKPGDWYFGTSPTLEILSVNGSFIAIGKDSQVSVSVRGPGNLSVNYLLFDPTKGTTVSTGRAAAAAGRNGTFTINFPSNLTTTIQPGSYQLSVVASSDALSVVAERGKLLDASTNAPQGVTTFTSQSLTSASPPGPNPTFLIGSVAVGATILVLLLAIFFFRARKRTRISATPLLPVQGIV